MGGCDVTHRGNNIGNELIRDDHSQINKRLFAYA